MEVQKETSIAIGAIENDRYIGITPPLSDEETIELLSSGVLPLSFAIKKIVEFEPHSTLIAVSDDSDVLRSPDGRTKRAVYVAKNIAETLEFSRGVFVEINEEPVALNGENSTPFYPDTDFIRYVHRYNSL